MPVGEASPPAPGARSLRFAPVIAAAGPTVFVGVFLIEGALRPGYSPLSEYVSALALGPRGWLQIASFILCGAGVMGLAALTRRALRARRAGRVGAVLLGIIGACLLASGPFVMDPAGTSPAAQTPHGLVHGILGGVVFLLMPVVPFVLAGPLRPPAAPRWAWWAMLGLGAVTAIADAVFIAVTKSPNLVTATEPFGGLIQRTVLIPFMAWCVVLALVLAKPHVPTHHDGGRDGRLRDGDRGSNGLLPS